jgi:hypothetical protein
MEKIAVQLTPGERRTEAFLFGALGSLAAGLFVWFLQKQFTQGAVARGVDVPKSDIERAMNHYGISAEEYLSHLSWYPLPERGSGWQRVGLN